MRTNAKTKIENGKQYEQRINYSLDMNMDQAIDLFEYVGYVYPSNGNSYWLGSNIPFDLVPVSCNDGYFYGDYETAKEIARHEYWVEVKPKTSKPKVDDGFDGDYEFDEE